MFTDLGALAAQCRFTDCAHETEPGCAVRHEAARDPAILGRLASLRKLEREQRRQEAAADSRLQAGPRRTLRRFMKAIRTQPHH